MNDRGDFDAILDVTRAIFQRVLGEQDIAEILSNGQQRLSEIKKMFFDRDYLSVFMSSPEHLVVYLVNYVPSRVLCYHDMFETQVPLIAEILTGRQRIVVHELKRRKLMREVKRGGDGIGTLAGFPDVSTLPVEVLQIGSGAASEVIAMAHLLTVEAKKLRVDKIRLTAIDIADWSSTQAAVKSAFQNESFIDFVFKQLDILRDIEFSFASSDLITFMFVLNELFQVSKKLTVDMLCRLVKQMKTGAHVLFVESAGSFSELAVGSLDFKVYQLLDGIKSLKLLPEQSCDARWFRVPKELQDSSELPLTNMRYFVRVYQKL